MGGGGEWTMYKTTKKDKVWGGDKKRVILMIINKPAIQSGRVYARKQYQSFLNENNNSVKESDVLKMKRENIDEKKSLEK